jgi:uncharacterized Zn finger protein (UPF0148 family)
MKNGEYFCVRCQMHVNNANSVDEHASSYASTSELKSQDLQTTLPSMDSSSSAAVPSISSYQPSPVKTKTPVVKSRTDQVSELLSTGMLRGWTLLGDCCPQCNTPLMRKLDKTMMCVACNLPVRKEKEQGKEKEQAKNTPASVPVVEEPVHEQEIVTVSASTTNEKNWDVQSEIIRRDIPLASASSVSSHHSKKHKLSPNRSDQFLGTQAPMPMDSLSMMTNDGGSSERNMADLDDFSRRGAQSTSNSNGPEDNENGITDVDDDSNPVHAALRSKAHEAAKRLLQESDPAKAREWVALIADCAKTIQTCRGMF